MPALIHSAGCRPPARETYSLHFIQEETLAVAALLSSSVFDDFPDLKIIVSHGGGAIPYQRGRFQPSALRGRAPPSTSSCASSSSTPACTPRTRIELLLRAVGHRPVPVRLREARHRLAIDPATGRWFDDIHLLIEDIDWLDDGQRKQLFETNARELFRHLTADGKDTVMARDRPRRSAPRTPRS